MSQIVSMLRNYCLLTAFTLALILIFTGSALAASDRRPPTADRQLPSILYPLSSPLYFFPLSSLATVYRLPSTEGAKLFKLWCSDCHGDKGQGLTPEWRAQWPEGKQNCWQSKCHGANHSPDGFSLPKKVPALIGPATLTKFSTAQDLYTYIRAAMPYWSPNHLKDQEYQTITTFLVEANYTARGLSSPLTLSDNLADITLSPDLHSFSTPYFLFPCLFSGCPPKP